MTESINNIVEFERQQAPEQARARAVQAMRQAGMEHADENTVGILAGEFPQVGKLESLLNEYGSALNAIQGSEETDMDLREGAYEELVGKIEPQYEEAARELKHGIAQRRQALQEQLFGLPESSAPYASGADRHSAQMNYRDALYTASAAKESELADHVALAEHTGDLTMLRAIGAVADMRGNRDLVHRYLKAAGAKAFETYTRRNALPADNMVDSVIGAFAPRRIERAALAPNHAAIQAREQAERNKQARRARLFGR